MIMISMKNRKTPNSDTLTGIFTMDFKKYLGFSTAIALLISAIFGCSFLNRYGKLRLAWSKEMTIEQLQQDWGNYDVYYAGYSVPFPAAIMFDPKNDERKLITDAWVQVEDPETVSNLVRNLWIDEQYSYPKLRKILSPDNQMYGYMYTAWDHAVIKVVDETTMWVEDLPHRPIHFEPAGEAEGN
jgi:hypothetical protein